MKFGNQKLKEWGVGSIFSTASRVVLSPGALWVVEGGRGSSTRSCELSPWGIRREGRRKGNIKAKRKGMLAVPETDVKYTCEASQ